MVQRKKRHISEPKQSPGLKKRSTLFEANSDEKDDSETGVLGIAIAGIIVVSVLFMIIYFVILPLFSNGDEQPLTEAAPPAPAAVEVLNGCGIPGIADKLAEFLQENSITVIDKGNADNFDYPETTVIGRDKEGKHAQMVKELLGVTNIAYDPDTSSVANVTVILGKDYAKYAPFNIK